MMGKKEELKVAYQEISALMSLNARGEATVRRLEKELTDALNGLNGANSTIKRLSNYPPQPEAVRVDFLGGYGLSTGYLVHPVVQDFKSGDVITTVTEFGRRPARVR